MLQVLHRCLILLVCHTVPTESICAANAAPAASLSTHMQCRFKPFDFQGKKENNFAFAYAIIRRQYQDWSTLKQIADDISVHLK